jgi:hypothetical protein
MRPGPYIYAAPRLARMPASGAVRIAADGRAVRDGLAGGEDAEGMPAVAA